MSVSTYSNSELSEHLRRVYAGKLATATVELRFVSDVVGGQPASPEGIHAFCEHHLKLTGEALEEAVNRITTGEVRKDGAGDEVKEVETYGLNILRRTEKMVAFIGTWQVRAMIKQTASRLGLLAAAGKRGAKGDLAEAMIVKPFGISALGGIQEICIVGPDGSPYTARTYRKFMGSVQGPNGRVSIVHDSEVAPVGSRVSFMLQWPAGKIEPDDMAAIFGLAQNIGLGSVKSLECGRFVVEKLEIQQDDTKPKAKEESKKK